MKKRYSISSFQCCQSIENFYANVAKIIRITVTDNTVYDCRKIRVTVPVQNCIFAYYKENGFSNVMTVPEQSLPDPSFSSAKSPNPEEADAWILARKYAIQTI